MSGLALREHLAEPANLWIRHGFSRWPRSGDGLWCDLVTGGLPPAPSGPPPSAQEAADLARSVTDAVYVPPLPPGEAQFGAHLFAAAAQAGVPLVIQVAAEFHFEAGELFVTVPRSDRSGLSAQPEHRAVVVVDLLDGLVRCAGALGRRVEERRQPGLPFDPRALAGANVVWPLVAGWTDQAELLGVAMSRLAAAGARRVVPRVMQLSARERRFLVERMESVWPEAFDVLFHGGDALPDAAAFESAAASAGLEPRLPRPLPAPPLPLRLRRARELAGRLIELGDAAGEDGSVHYRAARFLDRGEVDIDAAAREGNLDVLPWLEEPARTAVERWLSASEPRGEIHP